MKKNQNVAPISDFELRLACDVSRATFPAGSAPKRFIRDISAQTKLSDRGRCYLAYIANRFRRQYSLTPDQWAWVNEWLAKDRALEAEPKTPEAVPKPTQIAPSVEESKQLELIP